MLYFGPSVANAQLMAVALTRAGISAGVVSAATRPWTRRRLIEEFRAGRIRVLCNCEVLTAGFDAPLVTHVVMARPTTSLVLYQQIIGRGLRGPKFGGTASCAIVNCIDQTKIGPLHLAHERFRRLWEEGERDVTDDG
jgi:DNA repair protein RadD